MAPWHNGHFKLKEFEKWLVQKGLSDLKPAIKPSCEKYSPLIIKPSIKNTQVELFLGGLYFLMKASVSCKIDIK